jgi:hypothetical protein
MVNEHPNVLARERYETQHQKMSDSIFHRFLCPVCKTSKPTAGREMRGYKKGFRCADCKAKRNERMAAKVVAMNG